MIDPDWPAIVAGLRSGDIVPYLGPSALRGAVGPATGASMPADSTSLILAMNNGRSMAPRLMYEFPRAAMNQELKRGRSFINRFLTDLYGRQQWSRAPLHDWLARIRPPYVIDINRDTQLQDSYSDTPHTLVVGVARMGGTDYRFRLFAYDGAGYREIDPGTADLTVPVLFKPMGTPRPEPLFIASDADYVDYITELMGGFAVPAFLKTYRQGRRYLFLGLPLARDTERMVMSDLTYGAASPRGWALLPEPGDKERRFCARQDIRIIETDFEAMLLAADADMPPEVDPGAYITGC